MIIKPRPPIIRLTIFSLLVYLMFAFLAGCTGVTIKDDLPPSSPRGYADFANYTLGYDVIYSMKDGQKSKEGSLGYSGATLRVAKTPGNYDFIIEHEDDSGKKHSKLVKVNIERDMLTFITVDNKIIEVTDGINDWAPTTTVRYYLNVTVAKNPAPMHFESETTTWAVLHDLFNDPDWRARLYVVTSLGKIRTTHDEEFIKAVSTLATDDPHRLVRGKAVAFLKDLGIDPFKNLLLLENFDSNNKRRWISSTGQYTYFYNHKLLLKSPTGKCENEMMTAPLDLPRAFDVELVCTWKAGSDSDAYGILIGSDKENFNHFNISGDGKAIMRQTSNKELSADLIGWIIVDDIKKHASNRLRVEVRGDTWNYYVNGAYIGTIQNTLKLSAYTFGLSVCKGQTIAFEQLKIYRVPEN
jgi:hypothetical protein